MTFYIRVGSIEFTFAFYTPKSFEFARTPSLTIIEFAIHEDPIQSDYLLSSRIFPMRQSFDEMSCQSSALESSLTVLFFRISDTKQLPSPIQKLKLTSMLAHLPFPKLYLHIYTSHPKNLVLTLIEICILIIYYTRGRFLPKNQDCVDLRVGPIKIFIQGEHRAKEELSKN